MHSGTDAVGKKIIHHRSCWLLKMYSKLSHGHYGSCSEAHHTSSPMEPEDKALGPFPHWQAHTHEGGGRMGGW